MDEFCYDLMPMETNVSTDVKREKKEKITLKKGVYDSEYVINLLDTILQQIKRQQFGNNLSVTLTYSIEKLKKSIEMENCISSGIYHEPKIND